MAATNSSRSKKGPASAGFALDDYLLYNLVRAAAVYNDEMAAALKSFGLSTTEWRILMLLNDKSPSSVGDLSRRSVTKAPTLTRMLTRMENEGLVKRTSPAGDRRFVDVTMTPKAARRLRQVQEIGQRVFERACENVSASEIAAATDILKRLRANLQRSPYEAAPARARSAASGSGAANAD